MMSPEIMDDEPDLSEGDHPSLSPALSATPPLSYIIGDWVLIKYDNFIFPEEAKKLGDQEFKVSVMIPSGSSYKWPAP